MLPLMVMAPQAGATTPQIGSPCTRAEVSDYRNQANGVPTVCTYMGATGGYKWVGVANADPVTRAPGQWCSGTYPVAVTRQGKAVMCVGNSWGYGT